MKPKVKVGDVIIAHISPVGVRLVEVVSFIKSIFRKNKKPLIVGYKVCIVDGDERFHPAFDACAFTKGFPHEWFVDTEEVIEVVERA